MIPYQDLERALYRWKSRSTKEGATPEPTGEDLGTIPHGKNGLPPPMEHTGEIDLNGVNDMNDHIVESVDVGRRQHHQK